MHYPKSEGEKLKDQAKYTSHIAENQILNYKSQLQLSQSSEV